MIQLSFRKNLIYLLLTIIFYLLRRILSIIIDEIYGLNNSLIFCFLMFFGEIVGGLVIYYRQFAFLSKTKKNTNSLAYKFLKSETKLKREDKWPIIIVLIYFVSFFDLIEFIILSNLIPKIADLSTTSTLRLSFIETITSSIICYTTLRFKIGKHQIFSLTIMGISFIIIIVVEFIYRPEGVNLGNFIISYLLVFFHFILLSFMDVTERYLVDYDFLNPLLILMTEGIFGFISTLIYSIFHDPFKEIMIIYKDIETWKFVILLFLLILYSVFSAGINVYKILSNVFYSPMTKSLATYFLNSVFIIYHFIKENDFITEGERNYFYFFINLFISILIDFLGLIYNELFILNFCDLASDTHIGIDYRAKNQEIEMRMSRIEDDDYIYSIDENDEIKIQDDNK